MCVEMGNKMKYLWTEDTGAGLYFWQLANELFFGGELEVESKDCCISEHKDSIRCGQPNIKSGIMKMRMLIQSVEVQKVLRDIVV